MDFFSSAYEVVSAALIFFTGFIIAAVVGSFFELGLKRVLFLYFWHTMFCVLYCWYVLAYGGDAIAYYEYGSVWQGDFGVGSAAVRSISVVLVGVFGLSILGAFLVFNIFGVIGLLAFWSCIRTATRGKSLTVRLLGLLVVFLPSISFWTSAIGKDSIAFMSTGLALWSSMNFGKRHWLMSFAVLTMFLVRPHIAGLMILAVGCAVIFDPRVSTWGKAAFGILVAAVAAFLVPFSLEYAGVDSGGDLRQLLEYIDQRQSYNMRGVGGVDISEMNLPQQLVTYLFRPSLLDARDFLMVAAALENAVIMFIFFAGILSLFQGRQSGLGENRIFMWTYALAVWVILAATTANSGIALRQKWMFLPMLIFLLISVLGRRVYRKPLP